jgi:predicted nucleic acid-binding protein
MFLLDTNAISELRKVRAGNAGAGVGDWAQRVTTSDLFVSVIAIQELEIGVLRVERKDAGQGQILRSWLEERVLPAFSGRILPADIGIARRSARLHVPNPRPVRDALIAATALVHGMTVITRNVSDFVSTGVPVLNPWSD